MINFRYHIVSLIAVFLALAIGVIMGTAVIDRAVVDRLERQQSTLNDDINDVRAENDRLRTALREERDAAAQLAEEGSQRLLDGTLQNVPVLLIGAEGAEVDGLDGFVRLLAQAQADFRGTLWLTDRFSLDDEGEVRDLAKALDLRPEASPAALRSAALNRLARALRSAPLVFGVPEEASTLVRSLVDAGFVEFDAPDGAPDSSLPVLVSDTRTVLVSGPSVAVPDRLLMSPFLRALVAPRDDLAPASVLAVTGTPSEKPDGQTFITPIRDDDELAQRVSTVDDLDDFAGRLASVLALADLGEGRLGHYGRGPGAQRLLPAPAE